MTDYAEEQANELDVLRSIYPDEFEDVGTDPVQFRITIVSEEKMHGGDTEEVSVQLEVMYTTNYPDELPQLRVEPGDGELDEQEIIQLRDTVRAMAEESLGMAMVFSLASSLKEKLEEVVVVRRERIEHELEEQQRLANEAEQKKFAGSRVTPEAFKAWKISFDTEMVQLKTEKRRREEKSDPKRNKLSGRQLFEKDATLAASDATFIEEGDVTVDTALFEDEEDLVLTDEDEAGEEHSVAAMLQASKLE